VTDQSKAAQYSSYGRTQQSANMQITWLNRGVMVREASRNRK
jgi:hypothetical protein